MAHKPHWNPKPSKADLTDDVNELLVKLTGDRSEQLKHPERMAHSDLWMLSRVLDDVKQKLAKAVA